MEPDLDDVCFVLGRLSIKNLKFFLESLDSYCDEHNLTIQGFDERKIADMDHLLFAIHRAKESFSNNTNVAKNPGLEILRFASGQRQIDKAFSIGLSAGDNKCIFAIFGDLRNPEPVKSMFIEEFQLRKTTPTPLEEKKPYLMSQFGITKEELAAVGDDKLKDLVMERIALVDGTR
ncbi:hypothetical protein MsAc7_09620 [Methanolapillus millepedarum]|uniref:Kinase binding protein CGI-121 n=2 Tax=Methanolapillus millepedarum TaxID=3028296 RepID=A0AA96VF15_9EURY|nr:hypothetical protein MsAc7_09620 [Methanosarcinaceae archaeon Ac7]